MAAPEESARVRRRPHWLVLAGIALLTALALQWILVKPYRIPSDSMAPTLRAGQRVLVDRVSTSVADPQLRDVVVFHPPAGADARQTSAMCGALRLPGEPCLTPVRRTSKLTYIKRIVGLPGDRLSVRGGRVVRNGKPLDEPYATRCHAEPCEIGDFRVPRGSYFMMGDNRGHSSDSRFWGPVPRDQVIGRAFATYWPVRRIGGL